MAEYAVFWISEATPLESGIKNNDLKTDIMWDLYFFLVHIVYVCRF